jgi:hypothetical protein
VEGDGAKAASDGAPCCLEEGSVLCVLEGEKSSSPPLSPSFDSHFAARLRAGERHCRQLPAFARGDGGWRWTSELAQDAVALRV